MKQIIISLLTLALADICLCSCGNDVAANTSLEEMHKKSSITQSDEKHKKAITDSINNLREKIMDLTEKYEKVYQELSEVKMDNKKINDEKATNKWYILIGGGIGLLGLIVSIFAFGKTGKCNNRLSRHREEIESLRQLLNERRFEPNVTGTKRTNYSASSSIPNNEISDLSRKIQHLENELLKIQKTTLVHGTPTPSTITPPIKPTRIGYFGTAISGENGTGYFKKVLESKDSDARFSAQIIDRSANFEPIASLSSIKSSDYMDLAVEFEGVSKNEATDMSVHYKGLAQQIGDKWIIVKKAVITLKK